MADGASMKCEAQATSVCARHTAMLSPEGTAMVSGRPRRVIFHLVVCCCRSSSKRSAMNISSGVVTFRLVYCP